MAQMRKLVLASNIWVTFFSALKRLLITWEGKHSKPRDTVPTSDTRH